MSTLKPEEIRQRRVFTKGRVAFIVIVLLLVGRVIQHWPQYQANKERRQIAVAQYSHLKLTCLDVTDSPLFSNYKGDPRSQERLDALNVVLLPLIAAKCLKVSGVDIAENPYAGIKLATLDKSPEGTASWDLLQGVLFYLDHGFSPFLPTGGTLCTDGWIPPSRGPGTCSYHGGYAHARGSPLLFFSLKVIPNPVIS